MIPCPPGIPIVMPGENIGATDGSRLSNLRVLQHRAEAFPGLAKELEGAMNKGPEGPVLTCVLAEWTGLEPATPGVTGRYSNQLNYHSW